MSEQQRGIPASAMIEAFGRAGVSHFVTVPDFVQLALHQAVERGDGGMTLVRACNEDQAVCTAAGLTIAGAKPLIVVQNQGFYACINSVRAVALDAGIPSIFLIGQFGREHDNYGQPTTASRRRVVNLLEPVLGALGVPHWPLEQEADLDAVEAAVHSARTRGGPAALVIGRPLAWH
ncbi:thiamine pyrophosphate-binding protein [Paraburkholderia pallida]|uniref:Thiamine pyrophosphate-binding protein n=1 Tax=Paraburkholderia pallida TaxID=2547399 RepID=A0A4P7DAJ0_9BURK|nr:thiamine pyrophosphate-binding protein [Paraburkholderia pallida]QBR04230.1 thiamine pyrophosphate-binding protein [Paraburkholderia pallida]